MIDFDDLPTLIGPRRKQILQNRDDRERLMRAKAKRAKGAKNHATNKERSFADRRRAKKRRLLENGKRDAFRSFKDGVAAYWRGEVDCYPTKPEDES